MAALAAKRRAGLLRVVASTPRAQCAGQRPSRQRARSGVPDRQAYAAAPLTMESPVESLRRPSVLAAMAAALLVLNVLQLTGDGAGDDGTPAAAEGDVAAKDADGGDDDAATSGLADEDGAAGEGDDTAADGSDPADAGDDASGEEAASGDDQSAEDGADGDDDDDGEPAGDALGAPVAGTYTYASSGDWSMAATDAETDEYQLPATATATVTRDGDAWDLRLDAGDRYADEFGFLLGSDGGLDWVDWVLERTAPNLGGENRTAYRCSGDAAHYRPDETGRVATHVCETSAITSRGTIEHSGSEDITLGDGTVVTADRLLYTYTLEGEGVSGGGQLDLWLDPSTGLRLREVRTISSTTVSGATTFEYREDVQFTLQSLDPA